ncbi:MAG: hypothetical protein LBO73_04815 [Holosporaceae bacterium]|nr:hypothetical protein [Holosporaceae bacterium]
MKKTLSVIMLTLGVGNVYAMHGSEYALDAVRNANVITVNLRDNGRNLFTGIVNIDNLITGYNQIDNNFRGIGILKTIEGTPVLNVTRDFFLLDPTGRFVLNFPEGNVRFNGNIQCDSLSVYCRNFYCLDVDLEVKGRMEINAAKHIISFDSRITADTIHTAGTFIASMSI